MFVMVAETMTAPTVALARRWRPDVVVYEPTTYAGPLAAAVLGVPALRHTWGIDYTCLYREFEPEALAGLCARCGVDGVETLGAATVDPCPPVLQVPPSASVPVPVHRIPMRYVPYNGAGPAPGRPPAPGRRPRVCVTWGASSAQWDRRLVRPDVVLEALAGLDVDVVVAASTAVRELIGALPDGMRLVVDQPLHHFLPGCAAIVHQGGLGTLMTAAAHGVPQLLLPRLADTLLNARRLAATGAGDFALPGEADAAGVRARLEGLLRSPAHTGAAAVLRSEIDRLPNAGTTVRAVEALVARGGRPAADERGGG
jgi:UDP:flavonoid glycosyltransferase YjiC (YdhE family)